MESALTDKQVKRIKAIKTAGQSAEGLGWLIILIAPVYAFVEHYTLAVTIVVWILSIIAGTFLIYSGKYIIYGDGVRNRSFLWMNLLVSLLFLGGIIPLILTIQSVIGISAYRKIVKELGKPIAKEKKLPLETKEIIIFLILVLAGLGLMLKFGDTINNNATSNSSTSSQYGN